MAKAPKPPQPPKKKKKQSSRRRLGYWLLVAGTVLGVAAGVSYAVPIPGLTAAVTTNDPAKPDPAKEKEPEKTPQPSAEELAKKELDAREARLKEKEAQVSTLLKDLTSQKADLEPLRQAALMYENMPPYKAGPMMQSLDPAKAAQILKLMDEDLAGTIISYMEPAKGAQVMNEMLKPAADGN